MFVWVRGIFRSEISQKSHKWSITFVWSIYSLSCPLTTNSGVYNVSIIKFSKTEEITKQELHGEAVSWPGEPGAVETAAVVGLSDA